MSIEPDVKARFTELWLAGVPVADIMAEMGWSESRVTNTRHRWGLPARHSSRGRWEPTAAEVEIIREMWDANKPIRAIGKAAGVSAETARQYIVRLGLGPRNRDAVKALTMDRHAAPAAPWFSPYTPPRELLSRPADARFDGPRNASRRELILEQLSDRGRLSAPEPSMSLCGSSAAMCAL